MRGWFGEKFVRLGQGSSSCGRGQRIPDCRAAKLDETQAFQMDMEKGLQVWHD